MKLIRCKPRSAVQLACQRRALFTLCLVVATFAGASVRAQQVDPACGNVYLNNFGPHDYRVEQGHNRKVVEDFHFTPRVESLISGLSGSLGADIDYTLRAFPNHHRALVSMMNLSSRMKSSMPLGAQFSVECYFKRALLFRSDDVIVRMLYAKYLTSAGRRPEATRQLEFVVQAAPENGFTQYNAGLVYFEMGEFDKARQQAHRALSLGFEKQGGLKQQLLTAGKWSEPTPAGPTASASAAEALPPASPPSAPATVPPTR